MLNGLKGVFASFQKHDVKYLVIGGIASILNSPTIVWKGTKKVPAAHSLREIFSIDIIYP